uniref:Putative photosystem I PsaA/PsaB n=1 Tax=Helianthus annuus TaxID=4232 RepID=A0A1Y3BZD8_HELAN
MIIRSPEPEVKILVDRDHIKTSFEEWARPGHFSRTIAKGPETTTWIWNLHADAHDFDSHTSDLEEISRKVFSAHFGQLSIIFLWLSGMYFHGARFSNYEAWLSDPTHIGPSAQVVWPIVGQEILNGDLWRASGITSELQLYCTAIGALIFAALMLFAGWFHYHKAAPKLAWFQDVESMLNHHLAGLLGLGSLSWAGIKYIPVTGGLWLTDTAHHHLAIAILFLIAGHMYRTNWGIGHGLKDILEAHKGPFTGQGHKGLYEILTTSWHAQLSLNLAMLGSLTIVVAHHMYAMPPYPYLATDYGTQLSLFTHHMWIGGFLIVGAAAHAAIFMVRDYDPTTRYNDLLDRVLRHRDAIISHLNWAWGTCQVSAWDHVFLGLFWMYNSISVVIFHFSWKMQSDVWGSISDQGVVTHITGGNFAQSSITINGWLRDFLWAQASQFNVLFSGRGYWQELIESIVWAHNKLKVAPATQPRALSIVQGRAVGVTHYLLGGIATTWAFFLARIIADPTTRRIWFGIATAHDFESHDDITEERLYQNIFASHFGQLAIIFLWTSGNLFHVAWQGNFESWVQDPLHVRPIAHAIWDPHFGQPAVEAFTRGVLLAGEYRLFCSFLLFISAISLIAGWLHLQPKWKPSVSWFKNAESRLNHHLSGLFGVSSLAWTGHLVHVAIPASRGESVRWNNFLDVLPHPQGLGPLFTGQWNLYAQNPDSSSHLFGTSQGAGTAILTLLGDSIHKPKYERSFRCTYPSGGRLGRGHKGLYDTINNSIHFQLGLALASLGVITSLSLLGFHTLGLYVHNDVMLAFGTPEKQILIEPIFAQWIQSAHGKTSYGFDILLSSTSGPAFNAGRSIWLPGWLNAVNENSNSLFLTIGPGDFLVHHAIALGLHTTTLILVKGALDARGSKLMPDKKDFGYSFRAMAQDEAVLVIFRLGTHFIWQFFGC